MLGMLGSNHELGPKSVARVQIVPERMMPDKGNDCGAINEHRKEQNKGREDQ